MHVVAGVDAVQRRRADGEAGGLLRLVVGGDARVGRLVAAGLVVLGDDLVHGHAASHHGLHARAGARERRRALDAPDNGLARDVVEEAYVNHPGQALPDEAGDRVFVSWRLRDL